ncbi:MAG: LytTR family DNA-binding domain-containing protein [Prolixibacteraceae bacterium]|nr:LytTR family DNA-binding domain-containing protein [Prolixibacteraceae bacterium]
MKISCIIVDDEPLQQEILKDYILECPNLELKETLSDGKPVPGFLKEHNIDLMFLDINMPNLNGVELVKRLPNPPMIVFTTAYSEYAVEGFNLEAVDYLLKPISFERFSIAVTRAIEKIGITTKQQFLFVKADKKDYRVNLDDIIYIEAMGDYLRVHLADKTLTTHSTLKNMENQLPANRFVRIHKSYIVALPKIDYVEGNMVNLKRESLKIGENYRLPFFSKWKNVK